MQNNKLYIGVFFLLCLIYSCEDSTSINEVDYITLTRIDSEVSFGVKSRLELDIQKNKFFLYYADSLIYSSFFSNQNIDTLHLEEVKTDDLNKIYNVNSSNNVELELTFYSIKQSEVYMVKSFGQFGNNPQSIKHIYSILLKFMHVPTIGR